MIETYVSYRKLYKFEFTNYDVGLVCFHGQHDYHSLDTRLVDKYQPFRLALVEVDQGWYLQDLDYDIRIRIRSEVDLIYRSHVHHHTNYCWSVLSNFDYQSLSRR